MKSLVYYMFVYITTQNSLNSFGFCLLSHLHRFLHSHVRIGISRSLEKANLNQLPFPSRFKLINVSIFLEEPILFIHHSKPFIRDHW